MGLEQFRQNMALQRMTDTAMLISFAQAEAFLEVAEAAQKIADPHQDHDWQRLDAALANLNEKLGA